jgi:PTH1 family peptidyl-tRNA hydrolase
MDWLILGLGNPGPRYAHTRHNIGRDLVEAAGARWGIALGTARFNARVGTGRVGDAQVCLGLPLTFMNLSGEAAGALARFYKLPPAQVLAVYDEMDLPLGAMRLRAGGSAGGHNGMKSLIQHLGSQDFPRLRLGIGRPPVGWDAADYVLSRLAASETEDQRILIERGVDLLEDLLRVGLTATMNRWNGPRDTA